MATHARRPPPEPRWLRDVCEDAQEAAGTTLGAYKREQNKRRRQTVPDDWDSIEETAFVELVEVIRPAQLRHLYSRMGGALVSGYALCDKKQRLRLDPRLLLVATRHPAYQSQEQRQQALAEQKVRKELREDVGFANLRNMDGSMLHWIYKVCALEDGTAIAKEAAAVDIVYDPVRLTFAADDSDLRDKRSVAQALYALGVLYERPTWCMNEVALMLMNDARHRPRDDRPKDRDLLLPLIDGSLREAQDLLLSRQAAAAASGVHANRSTQASHEGLARLARDAPAIEALRTFVRCYGT